jgi:hypothetical protein
MQLSLTRTVTSHFVSLIEVSWIHILNVYFFTMVQTYPTLLLPILLSIITSAMPY